ncbi:putative heavy-metal chelation protein [Pseudonocardia sediminis]|uniref:Putative heavy-metal chelation protein n=1 Tax=Pseudonocardia sediminis TaxID=1397368 RepID=A0A4Q7V0F2_PSEST|nr:DUF364 domain-containing protein [Pseudonocardia sediminis]RZT87766.1 putative heavy-metal chelation protein [Pseudonocardia sediminis]
MRDWLEAGRERFTGELRSATASMVFVVTQGVRHAGRSTGYANTVLCVRVGSGTGTAAVAPGTLTGAETPRLVEEIVGTSVADLLEHPDPAVRLAALDAFLLDRAPHGTDPAARAVVLPPGDTVTRSRCRARTVAGLVDAAPSSRVAVIGVVNSLLEALRARGLQPVPCDLAGGETEWGEPVLTDTARAVDSADAVLATGMVLANGTWPELRDRCRARGIAPSVFAQTGSAVFAHLLRDELAALSAEPFPYFWLTGDAGTIWTYGPGRAGATERVSA